MTATLTPLHKSITVPWTPDAAFHRFTVQITEWWPLQSHSVGGKDAERVVFEGRQGGRIREIDRSGEEHTWGTVTHWEPPGRVAFTWHPGHSPDTAMQVEVRFAAHQSRGIRRRCPDVGGRHRQEAERGGRGVGAECIAGRAVRLSG